MKFFLKYVLFALTFLLLVTCKKVSEKNPVLIGKWVAYPQESICDYFYLDIEGNDKGLYGTVGGHGCGNKYHGKARANENHLYIGKTKFGSRLKVGEKINFSDFRVLNFYGAY
jgi:hypothetical protein